MRHPRACTVLERGPGSIVFLSQLRIVGEKFASGMVSKKLGQGSYRSVNSITCGTGESLRAVQPEAKHLNRASF